MRKTIKRIINIDSQFRDRFFDTNSNNFKVELNYDLRHVVGMKLHNIQLPNTWFNVSNTYGNNKFTINGHTYTIPDGNYDSITLVEKLDLLTSDTGLLFSESGFKLGVDCETGQSFFHHISGENIQLTFSDLDERDTENLHSFGWMLGFRKPNYNYANGHVSEGIANFGGINYFYLVVDDKNTHSHDIVIGNLRDSYISKNILAIIRVNEVKYVIVNKDDYEAQKRIFLKPVRIKQLLIKLLDPWGNLIDFNNMDFSFSIEFEIEVQ